VEIVTASHAKPNPAWLNYVATGKARSHIRRFLKTMQYEESARLGERMLNQAFSSFKVDPQTVSEAQWEKTARESGAKSKKDLLADIGLGKHLPAVMARRLAASPGESLSGTSGASDVITILGTEGMAVQFAKLRGARVFAIASGEDGVALVRRLGADRAVDRAREDIITAAHEFAPDGVHALLALAGGDALERCLDALRPGGRCAYPNGVEPEPKKRRGIDMMSYDAVSGVREFERLGRAVEDAKLRAPIAAAYPLEEAAKAHERLAEGHVLGKILLRIR